MSGGNRPLEAVAGTPSPSSGIEELCLPTRLNKKITSWGILAGYLLFKLVGIDISSSE
jgi:hypothetical protein